jgi:hypothetical protein
MHENWQRATNELFEGALLAVPEQVNFDKCKKE